MKKGDKISVIDEDLKGTIIAVRGMAVIFEDEYGFTHEYPAQKLVVRNYNIYKDIQVEKKFEYCSTPSRQPQRKHLVLDLHFDKLVPNPSDYDSFERLFIQKEKLLDMLDFCKKNNLKKLEIIHGIGDGTLQKMVYDTLHSKGNILFDDHEFFYHQSGSVIIEFI